MLAIVAEKTGYPQDMLDLDLDLEADLGIDTVKQAETFAAIRETFAIPLQESLNLRDYPTLAAVIGFVYAARPDLQEAGSPQSSQRGTEEIEAVEAASAQGTPQQAAPAIDRHAGGCGRDAATRAGAGAAPGPRVCASRPASR